MAHPAAPLPGRPSEAGPRRRTMSKFKVPEIARVPSQTWEHVAYIAITHMRRRTSMAKRIQDRIVESRGQQGNELWHLLILQELIRRRRAPVPAHCVLAAQAIAFMYYQLSWLSSSCTRSGATG
jgi:ubiquinol oxidase